MLSWPYNASSKRTARDADLECQLGHVFKQQRMTDALDFARVSDDHRDEMNNAMLLLSDAQLEEILIQAAYRDDATRDIILGVSEKMKQEEEKSSSYEIHIIHEKIRNLINLAADVQAEYFPQNRCERRCIARVARLLENDLVENLKPEDTLQKKQMVVEYLFDVAGTLASSLSKVQPALCKAAIPDCITNSIFKVQSLFSEDEMFRVVGEGQIFQKASAAWRLIEDVERGVDWLPLKDACELYDQPSTVLNFDRAREQAQYVLTICSPMTYSQFEDRTGPTWNKWRTAGQLKKDVETAIIRGITRKLNVRSSIESRVNALRILVSIGIMIQVARSFPDHQYQSQILETLDLDNLVTDALKYVINLPHERDFSWKLSNLGNQALGLRNDFLELEQRAGGKTFPELLPILIQLGIR
ncbi:hypothetical protein K3495_g1440 [Podosphaera aphanis]|nr:hypothetical protein K3495_g1440 [Podosphaera aphanis]